MRKLYFLSTILFVTLIGCQKGSDNIPSPNSPNSEYYIAFKANNKDYVFTKPSRIEMSRPQGTNSGFTYMEAYDDPLRITIYIWQALSGKPETVPISTGIFATSRFEEYGADINDKGTLTVTKIDNNTVEGSFNMNVYLKGTNSKLSLTNGRLRLKF